MKNISPPPGGLYRAGRASVNRVPGTCIAGTSSTEVFRLMLVLRTATNLPLPHSADDNGAESALAVLRTPSRKHGRCFLTYESLPRHSPSLSVELLDNTLELCPGSPFFIIQIAAHREIDHHGPCGHIKLSLSFNLDRQASSYWLPIAPAQ